jgi:hypothetical protein
LRHFESVPSLELPRKEAAPIRPDFA